YQTVDLWDMTVRPPKQLATQTTTGTPARDLRPFPCLAFGPDGKTLAMGTLDHGARVLDLSVLPPKTPRSIPRRPELMSALALSPDGKTLATGGLSDTVYLWHAAPDQVRWAL